MTSRRPAMSALKSMRFPEFMSYTAALPFRQQTTEAHLPNYREKTDSRSAGQSCPCLEFPSISITPLCLAFNWTASSVRPRSVAILWAERFCLAKRMSSAICTGVQFAGSAEQREVSPLTPDFLTRPQDRGHRSSTGLAGAACCAE